MRDSSGRIMTATFVIMLSLRCTVFLEAEVQRRAAISCPQWKFVGDISLLVRTGARTGAMRTKCEHI